MVYENVILGTQIEWYAYLVFSERSSLLLTWQVFLRQLIYLYKLQMVKSSWVITFATITILHLNSYHLSLGSSNNIKISFLGNYNYCNNYNKRYLKYFCCNCQFSYPRRCRLRIPNRFNDYVTS
jgi:hypothetical protein